jgi:cytochrome c6
MNLAAPAQTPEKWEAAANAFKANCTTCHAEDGSGTALGNRLHVKNLYSKEVQDKPSSDLAHTISDGKNNMPAFKNRLSSNQIQDLVEYIRHEAQKQH